MPKKKPGRRPLALGAKVGRVVDMQQKTGRGGATGPAGRRRWVNQQRASGQPNRAT